MEVYQPSPPLSPQPFLPHYSSDSDPSDKLAQDLSYKLTLDLLRREDSADKDPNFEKQAPENEPELQGKEKGGGGEEKGGEKDENKGEEEEENDDFSFCCVLPDGSPISAEDLFADGRIRPAFPLFDQSLLRSGEPKAIYPLRPPLKKLFAEEGECSDKVVEEIELPSPGSCRKSNSTGSSKLCRFMDSVTRSSSDGKDAFVFLNKGDAALKARRDGGVIASNKIATKEREKGKEKVRCKTTSSSSGHERNYAKKRTTKEGEKHKCYLPYRRDLLGGFFTNSNLLSKNVHPF